MARFSFPQYLLIFLVTLTNNTSFAQSIDAKESILVSERDQSFDITVPISKIALRLPEADFKISTSPPSAGSTASSRYFAFEDRVHGVLLSGWFESARQFPGVKEPSAGSFGGDHLTHKNVSFEKLGDWDVVNFDVTFRSTTTANLQAHLVRAGTWIELHLSGYPSYPLAEQHALLIQTVRSIQVSEKH